MVHAPTLILFWQTCTEASTRCTCTNGIDMMSLFQPQTFEQLWFTFEVHLRHNLSMHTPPAVWLVTCGQLLDCVTLMLPTLTSSWLSASALN